MKKQNKKGDAKTKAIIFVVIVLVLVAAFVLYTTTSNDENGSFDNDVSEEDFSEVETTDQILNEIDDAFDYFE